jgi:hypothetical protein
MPRPPGPNTAELKFLLPPETLDQLRRLALANQRTISGEARLALAERLARESARSTERT